jgi:hypothetical protein
MRPGVGENIWSTDDLARSRSFFDFVARQFGFVAPLPFGRFGEHTRGPHWDGAFGKPRWDRALLRHLLYPLERNVAEAVVQLQ